MAYSRSMDRITAVYDGKALVLQQPVDWPTGTVVEVKPPEPLIEVGRMTPDEAWEWLMSHPRRGGGGGEFDRGDLYL